MAGRNRNQTVRDMVLSLVVIGAFVAVIWSVLPHDATEKPPKAVTYEVELVTARRAADYPVAAPEGLAKTWKATSVRYNGAEFSSWHLGFHGSDDRYIAIEQSKERASRFIDRVARRADETDVTKEIGGKKWVRYEGSDYDALVLKEKGSTTVVTGKATFADLEHMAGLLKMA
nr:DUF4245 domain-containing protein [Streptomyces sp. NA04227]